MIERKYSIDYPEKREIGENEIENKFWDAIAAQEIAIEDNVHAITIAEMLDALEDAGFLRLTPTKTGPSPFTLDPAHTCVVCRQRWVDSDAGFDTCEACGFWAPYDTLAERDMDVGSSLDRLLDGENDG